MAPARLPGIPTRLRAIEAEHGLDSSLLDHALRAAFALADAGFGALFTIGDVTKITSFAGKLPPAAFQWRGISLSQHDLLPVLFSARQDGATVFDEKGVLRMTMVILQPP